MTKNITVGSSDTGNASFSESTEASKSRNETLWLRVMAVFSKVAVHRRPRELKICETLSLGDKRLLALIECGRQRFLIAATSHNISLLRALDADKEEDHNLDPS